MRILVLNYEYPPLGGGAAPVCQQLCEMYVREGHEAEVVTMGYGSLPYRERRGGVDILRVPALRKRPESCETHEMVSYVLSALPLVIWRLIRNDYDVIHCHFVVPTGLLAYLATLWSRVPVVITAHGSDIPGFNPERFTREHRYLGPLLRRIMSRAARVVTPSVYLGGLMAANVGFDEAVHIPNGIELARFTPRTKLRRLLMTGRLLRRKGFQHVLEALAGLDTDYEIHIAGDGPMRAELEALARRLNLEVLFHGWLDHDSPLLKELYETSTIFCLPSESENASIALLEAMLAGMAVITSDATGCPETVGPSGIVVPPGDVDALKEALATVFNSDELCADLGKRARQRVHERFDWNRIGDAYLKLFEDVQRVRAPVP